MQPVALFFSGSGEIRIRDQRIKRSPGSSKTYMSQGLAGAKNSCAIDCAIAFWCMALNLVFITNLG